MIFNEVWILLGLFYIEWACFRNLGVLTISTHSVTAWWWLNGWWCNQFIVWWWAVTHFVTVSSNMTWFDLSLTLSLFLVTARSNKMASPMTVLGKTVYSFSSTLQKRGQKLGASLTSTTTTSSSDQWSGNHGNSKPSHHDDTGHNKSRHRHYSSSDSPTSSSSASSHQSGGGSYGGRSSSVTTSSGGAQQTGYGYRGRETGKFTQSQVRSKFLA